MAVPAGTGRSKASQRAVQGSKGSGGPHGKHGKERFRVDLTNYHADCDANYLRLCKLLPELANHQSWSYRMPHGTLEVTVLERSRYTTEVCLRTAPQNSGANEHGWLTPPPITVRLYHDARMAEVVAVDGQGPIGGNGLNFSYPNPAMHNEDERQQVNRFLSEWLAHCLANGRAEVELPFRGSPT
ncbi:DUF1249 domain-containing protein [Microbulbifer salipaludis]|uniref:DUF1249 domain-containing protein n=1 Tax=Microbulbifer salipaludis TaxID=187980 RepID=A0ABS3E4C5_9GAMM|nr:DUF1249 domain-containing protein [Microbulbifer salipaludis]MBN8430156.1 DUF1249 domain-containing protein [Microbulbifer salipaludis]